VDTAWTLAELVAQVAARIAALPPPRNGQVRAIPDERTVRYYGTIGLLDRPSAMRGRTALYGAKHVAQVVAIKRLQAAGRSLAEIQQLWPTLDDPTLARMSGVELAAAPRPAGRAEFWKREAREQAPAREPARARHGGPAHEGAQAHEQALAREWLAREEAGACDGTQAHEEPAAREGAEARGMAVELRVALAPSVVLLMTVAGDSVAMSPADVRAIRAAAAPLLAELASRRLASHPGGEP